MFKSRFILCLTFFIATTAAVAQTSCAFRFSGTVTDETGEPLPGATIVLNEASDGRVTDGVGSFSFEGLCKRRHEVVIQFLGYKTQTLQINIDHDVRRDIVMEPEARGLEEVVVTDKREN